MTKPGKKEEMEEIVLFFDDPTLALLEKKAIEECHQKTIISQVTSIVKYLEICGEQLKEK